MKLLFDHNHSFKLAIRLTDLFPGSKQLRQLGMEQYDDRDVWLHAGRHDYTIVTQDADIAEMAALYGPPPHVVWLRCGNQPTRFIEELIRRAAPTIEAAAISEQGCLELYG